ncbi:hypothetical protein QNO07_12050 [Streptomyces sp. 549]|uniref:hypothetical protein n=1 Tax=Streptomyces sp. 549 TaxID=3049076 RepID=UPI0024C35267|nr:hypothetical protein [Streptomyces sp. 549]MDK1474139.1 hypothetical protein [Streptomyces sp. 549]
MSDHQNHQEQDRPRTRETHQETHRDPNARTPDPPETGAGSGAETEHAGQLEEVGAEGEAGTEVDAEDGEPAGGDVERSRRADQETPD